MATPAVTAAALHGNLTACHGNPHDTSIIKSIFFKILAQNIFWVRVPWYALWKVLCYAVEGFCSRCIPRHVAKKDNDVQAGRRHRRPNYGTGYCAGRGLDSTTKEEGDKALTSGEETDRTHPADKFFFVDQIRTASARSF